ncbi:unnamed protein product [Soboliphyme baturini]|uniref:G domain-containing protein n=1 Tax=Soboliphyme baturini TaxID=241478 RepID=A0A183J4F9_9BILA|nr:unnamed protein product [Soboliphyme baturini]
MKKEEANVAKKEESPPYKNLQMEIADHKRVIKVSDLNHPIDRTFRVMMAGDSSVGKSSIILRMGDASKDRKIVLCCNKCDLRKDNDPDGFVSTNDGRELANSINADFTEVSAKDGTNVQHMALTLAR